MSRNFDDQTTSLFPSISSSAPSSSSGATSSLNTEPVGISRLQARPYYDPDTFNIGYSSVFNPDKGVLDINGTPIASKLSIANQNNSNTAGSKNIFQDSDSIFSKFPLIYGSNKRRNMYGNSNNNNILGNNNLNTNNSSKRISPPLEWNEIIILKKWKENIVQICKNFINVYFNHLIQQPFEISKIIMQIIDFKPPMILPSNSDGSIPNNTPIILEDSYGNIINEDQDTNGFQNLGNEKEEDDDDDEEEEIDYFPIKRSIELEPPTLNNDTSSDTNDTDDNTHRDKRNKRISLVDPNVITPLSLNTIDILNSIIDTEGIVGLWRANHTTFLLNFLKISINSWLVNLISSSLIGINNSTNILILPKSSFQHLILANLISNILTNLILIPIDLIKLKLIVTSINTDNKNKRSLRHMIKNWSWRNDGPKLPISIWLSTILKSIVTVTFGKNFDILIYYKFNLEKFSNWKIFYSIKFLSKIIELIFKLPVETILRRNQLNFLLNYNSNLKIKTIDNTPKKMYISKMKVKHTTTKTEENEPTSIELHDKLIIRPNFSTNISKDLWNGWKISLISVCCGYGFRMLNKIDDDLKLELEKF
ncbi:mitofusin complex protein UGO1 NDAI_0H00990 [Naumovozyma dairenensis CBS 421]|uniref:Mitochondrial fusion and transport protein UGO1 n=1 Tax=Naumovozyma dairenensis (strain ATCC 10597 / BCRC 20456 / CBS 421 / NBRC 0211 / NRRL Y-12639) TaxID=1071378 RepID=G0WER2_NAUDC|nr:hypothetical protein NDAI_0H00990 [Naumovozyma dairenensis CBS 421]CCD26273.1 hypothetical protein NDAI_0H00990 [Naumovozyma dairenensis CBS 421]